ncbi:hypothetical protein U0Y27_11635, partial [Acinetobacter baumannii]
VGTFSKWADRSLGGSTRQTRVLGLLDSLFGI